MFCLFKCKRAHHITHDEYQKRIDWDNASAQTAADIRNALPLVFKKHSIVIDGVEYIKLSDANDCVEDCC